MFESFIKSPIVAAMAKKPKDTQEEQSKRFRDMARELEVEETEAEEQRVFGQVGKPKDETKKSTK